jgi:hypothetical protein
MAIATARNREPNSLGDPDVRGCVDYRHYTYET